MTSTERLGLDLLVSVDRAGDRSLRVQLEDQLRDGIRRGALHAGHAAAVDARAGRRARRLARGGRRGLRAARRRGLPGGARGGRGDARGPQRRPPRSGAAAARRRGSPPPVRFDLRTEPPTSRRSRGARGWRRCASPARRARRRPRLRRPARRARRCARRSRPTSAAPRGVAAEPGDVVVCTGITQAIALLARALRAPAPRASPSRTRASRVHRMVFAREGLQVVPVPVDADGLVVDALRPRRRRRGAAHARRTSSRSAMALAPERRAALVDWAAAREAWILEDDYDGEYRFDRDPVGALQALAPARVTYLGSASKTLAPALRMGWMVVAPDLLEAVGDAKTLADSGSPQLDQLALARFIERGELDRHLRRMRGSFRRRRDALIAALAERAARAGGRGHPGGPARLRRGCRPRSRSGRCWRRRGQRSIGLFGFQHGDVAPHPARLRQPARAFGASRRCGSWPGSCAAPARSGWGRRRTRAGRRTRRRAARRGGARRTSRSRGGRRRGSGCRARARC